MFIHVPISGCLLIIGGLALNGIPMGMLMRDPSYLENEPKLKTGEIPKSKRHKEEKTPLLKSIDDNKSIQNKDKDKTDDNAASDTELTEDDYKSNKKIKTRLQEVLKTFGLHHLKNWILDVYLVSMSLSQLAHDVLIFFVSDRAIEIGCTIYQSSMTVVVYNAMIMVSRLVVGLTRFDKFHQKVIVLVLYAFGSGLNVILAVLWTSFPMYLVFVVLFGISRGIFKIYLMTILVDIVGKENVHHGSGLLLTTTGFWFLTFIPLFGYSNEKTGSYTATFLTFGGLEIIGGLVFASIPIYLFKKTRLGHKQHSNKR